MKNDKIGLALSGGGVRAAAFHAGVLQYLAEQGQMEEVVYISSVSGGSLLTGLVFNLAHGKWPNSVEYQDEILPKVRSTLTRRSLQTTALVQLLLNPLNWRFLFARVHMLAKTIKKVWKIDSKLRDLPSAPVWAINATPAENGKRFRIKGTELGDYELGYTQIPSFLVADAMAISAAFPVGIGPYTLNTTKYSWKKRKSWDSKDLIPDYRPKFSALHLYDGGLYDNLGLEPLFDVGSQTIKSISGTIVTRVIVSDASSAPANSSIPGFLNPMRIMRMIDITLTQVRFLRIRAFVNFCKKSPNQGSYFQIGSTLKSNRELLGLPGLGASTEVGTAFGDSDFSAQFPTTLKKMTESDFDRIARHGYLVAKGNLALQTPVIDSQVPEEEDHTQ